MSKIPPIEEIIFRYLKLNSGKKFVNFVSQPSLKVFSVHLGIFEKKLKAAGSAVIENRKTINGINAAIIANSFTGTNFVTYNAENPIEVVKHVKNIGFKRFLINLTQESLAFKPAVLRP